MHTMGCKMAVWGVLGKALAMAKECMAGVGVSRSRISQLAAAGNGKGKWGNVKECQKYLVGNVEKMCAIRRKLEGN